ncbi:MULTISPECIES: hypothetical protein [Vitreoscilla]|uniref:Transposase n=1 Tax=Vitreoscilla stercoraria TaxID=61 RepID=A0ABY4ECR5_VITST|nr:MULTISPECIES: hypothetical protein [Vitreoscilla]UOO93081.1 hypothetical protein LVJ81_03365 [Vitreoscilla stercoraria]
MMIPSGYQRYNRFFKFSNATPKEWHQQMIVSEQSGTTKKNKKKITGQLDVE